MEQPITSTSSKGILIALIMIVLSLAMYFLDMQNAAMGWISYGIFFIGIILSVSIYGKQINYNSGFGNYFTHGFKITALVTVIMIIFMAIFIIAFPEVKEKALQEQKIALDKMGTLTDEQMKQSTELTRKFFMVFTIGGTLLQYIILGTLAALVGAGITKKRPNQNQGFTELK
jgi:hypothetical protein